MTLARMSPNELHEMIQRKQERLTIIDVRSRERYDEGHVPGAIHIHVDELETQMPSLPKDHLLVTY